VHTDLVLATGAAPVVMVSLCVLWPHARLRADELSSALRLSWTGGLPVPTVPHVAAWHCVGNQCQAQM